jgi:hypothetical protein
VELYLKSPIRLHGMHMGQFTFCRSRKVKVTLDQAMKAQRGSRGVALLFL